jgi:hypothetical protein
MTPEKACSSREVFSVFSSWAYSILISYLPRREEHYMLLASTWAAGGMVRNHADQLGCARIVAKLMRYDGDAA